ncbi:MAG TPA: cytochrome c [Vicinamibacterales bacterium]|nr:cytochrome c [Vicinamibacterales bacterium]
MRRFGLSMLAVVVAFGVNLLAANEKPSDAMKAVMNANAAANAAVREAQKANNFDAALATVATYKANYAYIDAFFTHKKVDAAAQMARNGAKAALELEAAATKKDAAALEKAVAGVTGTCGGCHKQYREQLPDKTYEVKLP